MRQRLSLVMVVMSFIALFSSPAKGQQGRGGAATTPDVPSNKTSFWTNDDIQNRWKDNEAKKTINSRLFNGSYNISTNVRIVLPDDPPQTHDTTADLWIMTAGTATAETDGEMMDSNGTKIIRN